jgi:hypothetical protein
MNYPKIEIGKRYETDTLHYEGSRTLRRVLCVDCAKPGYPVLIEFDDGVAHYLTADGKLLQGDRYPFIREVQPKEDEPTAWPPIEMGFAYRTAHDKRLGRVLCVNGKKPGKPVVFESADGHLHKLCSNGKILPSDPKPYIERVPEMIELPVTIWHSKRDGMYYTADQMPLDAWELVAKTTIMVQKGEGL